MKRWLIPLVVIILFMGGLVLTIFWLFGTTEGTTWVMGTVSRLTSTKIEAQKISGRIGDELKMEGLRIIWPEGEIKVEEFHLQWNPLYLLMGKAIIEKLTIREIYIQNNRSDSENAFGLQWPKVPTWIYWIHGKVTFFYIDGLKYIRLNKNPVRVDQFSTRLDWKYGLLTLNQMALDTPSVSAEGILELGFHSPSLYLDLNVISTPSLIGFNKFHLHSRLLPSRGSEQVTGNIFMEGLSQSVKRLLIESEIGITQSTILFRKILISSPHREGTLIGEGKITFPPNDLKVNLEMQFSDVDLSQEIGIKTAFSGILHIEGKPNHYQGNIKIENMKGKWTSGSLFGTFKGSLQEAQMTVLDGSMLNGHVQGDLIAQWKEGFYLKGALQARNLDPSVITPDWSGRIHLDLEGTFRKSRQKSFEGRLRIHLLQSHLRGKQLSGEIDLFLEDSALRIAKADLKGKGFDLSAKGGLQERVTFNANISDLSGLIPGIMGSLFVKGWIRWRDQHLSLDVSSRGKDLSIKGIELGAVNLLVRFDEREEFPLEFKGGFHKVVYRSFRMDSVSIGVDGRLLDHKIIVEAQRRDGQIKCVFLGGYTKKRWRGMIHHFSGGDASGSWRLQSPAEVDVSLQKIKVKSLQIKSTNGEGLHLNSDLSLHPLKGILQAEWHQLNLARANSWLKTQRLTGQTTGAISFQWFEEDRLKMSASVHLEGTFTNPLMEIELLRGRVKLDWNEKKLQTLGEFEFSSGGKFHVNLSSSQPARMAFPQQVRFNARWESIDLSLFRSWLPQTITFEGKSSGWLSGQWAQGSLFNHTGKIRVSEGMLKWRNKQGQISSNLKSLELNWIWQDEFLKGHLSFTLTDYGCLEGTFLLPVAPRHPWVIQKKGALEISLKGRLTERGLLSAFFPDTVWKSQSQIEVILNAQGTWENPKMMGLLKLGKTELHLLIGKAQPPITGNSISETLLKLVLSQGLINLNWDERGLISSCHLELANGSKFHGNLSSTKPAQMGLPDKGTVMANWDGIDLSLMKPFLPGKINLEGGVIGCLTGQWSNRHFETTGEMKVSRGLVQWQNEKGSIKVPLREGEIKWNWRDESLSAELSLSLLEHGYVKGNFALPLSSHFPLSIRPTGSFELFLNGQFEESGLLSAFLPGMIQKSQGQLQVNLVGKGTWERPFLEGDLKLDKAKAYLPAAGIHLDEFTVEARFKGEEIQFTSFRIRSGPGQLIGDAIVKIKNWKVSHYQGHIRGERFQTIHLPELRVLSNPRLNFHGTPQKLFIKGEIVIPDLLISGPPTREVIRSSPDVIIMDTLEPIQKDLPFPLNIQIRLLLGEKVFVKAEGIDAQITGNLLITAQDLAKMIAEGEIKTIKGQYNAYGQKLDIVRGHLLFTGGPIGNPNIDALAIRRIGETQAGVSVTGSLQKPIVRLYSRPSMSDTDILSYIVFGQPLGRGTESIPSLIQASAALLSAGESVILQGRLKKLFGLDTLDITTSPGGDDISRSMVTIGKYLTPKLYVSLGRSLFTDATLVTLRYTFSKRMEIEATAGTESGATLFYRIEFK